MKTLWKLLIAFAITLITVFASNVIAHYMELSFEVVYCHVASFVIGVLAVNAASWIIDKITDKNEQI